MSASDKAAILALVKQVEELNTAVSDLSQRNIDLAVVIQAMSKRILDDAESFEFRVQNLIKGIK